MQTALSVAKRTAALMLLADMAHCFRFVSGYYAEDEAAEDAQLQADCDAAALVSRDEFERHVQLALDRLEAPGALEHRLRSPTLKVSREAITFAGGGRATLLQLAHPFVAAGRRGARAARGVRGLHAKVHGEVGEAVGALAASARFDADQKDALRYVQWTLLETSVFEYELHVGWLAEAEKDEMARASARFLLLFGVPLLPEEEAVTYRQFRRRLDATLRSGLVGVSDAALDTLEFLVLPPAPQFAPLMGFVRWSSLVSLPPRLALLYGGRRHDTLADRLLFGVLHGLLRFANRLLPGSFRFLAAYWAMHERVHGPRGRLSSLLSALSAFAAERFVALLMPERDPAEALAQVRELRARRAPFDRTTGELVRV
ncbi:hypothetical protein BASA81_009805 [Batrachochytrium salamandrivorans]|nr:hypothetical protein BASA81_009805 [Batrachochytrium salamandrivorans]